MYRQPVNSSMFLSVGYMYDLEILEVEFTTGEVYQYYNLPVSRYIELMKAPSLGTYFNVYIRDQFDFKKISV